MTASETNTIQYEGPFQRFFDLGKGRRDSAARAAVALATKRLVDDGLTLPEGEMGKVCDYVLKRAGFTGSHRNRWENYAKTVRNNTERVTNRRWPRGEYESDQQRASWEIADAICAEAHRRAGELLEQAELPLE